MAFDHLAAETLPICGVTEQQREWRVASPHSGYKLYDCVCPDRVDPYGFERHHDFEPYKEMMNEYIAVLNRRSMRWSKLLEEKPQVEKNLTGMKKKKRNPKFLKNVMELLER